MKNTKNNFANVTSLQKTGKCNFYDVEEKMSCYKNAIIRYDADSRMLCNIHYKKYKEILTIRNNPSKI